MITRGGKFIGIEKEVFVLLIKRTTTANVFEGMNNKGKKPVRISLIVCCNSDGFLYIPRYNFSMLASFLNSKERNNLMFEEQRERAR